MWTQPLEKKKKTVQHNFVPLILFVCLSLETLRLKSDIKKWLSKMIINLLIIIIIIIGLFIQHQTKHEKST